MDYAKSENHSYGAVHSYFKEAFCLLFPISAIYGVLAVLSGGGLRKIFESGAFEHIAVLTIPMAFSGLLIFAGFSAVLSAIGGRIFAAARRSANYFAVLTVSLAAALFSVCAGIAVPFALVNGLKMGIGFAVQAALLVAGLVFAAHQIGILLYFDWPPFIRRYRNLLGVGVSVVGVEIFVLEVVERLQTLSIC